MTKVNDKYWNPYALLPYQRRFIFVNGERSIGKTYSLQKFIIERALDKGEEFIYIVRTAKEKDAGALEKWFKKVLMNEFPKCVIECTTEVMTLRIEGEESDEKITLGYCYALSESVKVKKASFPNVYWMVQDEYMLEKKQGVQYVNGWNEPDLALSIYHTVDREEDRVTYWFLGNNTSFYNPYHMHPAFRIPNIEKGQIWTSENVLFQWASASPSLQEDKKKCKFLKMIEQTEYGRYASKGEYVDDNNNFIQKLPEGANYCFTFIYDKQKYGVYSDYKNALVFVSDKVDPSCKQTYAFTKADHEEGSVLAVKYNMASIKWLTTAYKQGNVRFISMEVKARAEEGMYKFM